MGNRAMRCHVATLVGAALLLMGGGGGLADLRPEAYDHHRTEGAVLRVHWRYDRASVNGIAAIGIVEPTAAVSMIVRLTLVGRGPDGATLHQATTSFYIDKEATYPAEPFRLSIPRDPRVADLELDVSYRLRGGGY